MHDRVCEWRMVAGDCREFDLAVARKLSCCGPSDLSGTIGFDMDHFLCLPADTIVRAMKRFFAFLLMLVLPLQFSFAAASAYCGHEQGVAARHAGHHQHQHLKDAVELTGDQKSPSEIPSAQHADCGQCHAACATMPAAPAHSQPVAVSGAHYSPRFPSHRISFRIRSTVHPSPSAPDGAAASDLS